MSEHGEQFVPRNGNIAQAQRENAALSMPTAGTHATRPLSARELCHRMGLPEACIAFVQQVVDAQDEILRLHEDVRLLAGRLFDLEIKS